MENAEKYLSELSNTELSELVNELEKVAINEASGLRKAVREIYGDEGIFVLHVTRLIYPLLKEVHTRLVNERLEALTNEIKKVK